LIIQSLVPVPFPFARLNALQPAVKHSHTEQQRCIAWHTDSAAASSIVPFDVHARKFIACHVVLDAMEFLEDIEEVGEVF
jgi:hypothetical protein